MSLISIKLKYTRQVKPFIAGALLLTPGVGHTYDLKVTPKILVAEHYTDNLYLDTRKDRELISEVTPGMGLQAQTTRLNLNADYSLQNRWQYGADTHSTSHKANGRGEFALIRDYVDVFGGGRLYQRSASLTQSQLINDDFVYNNLADVGSAYGGFRFQNPVTSNVKSSMEYRYGVTRSTTDLYADSDTHILNASLANGDKLQRVIWQLKGYASELDNETAGLRKTGNANAALGYRFNKKSSLILALGYEVNPDVTRVNNDTRGRTATLTGRWQVGPRLALSAMGGERSFGETYLLTADWQSKNTGIQAKASRETIGDILSVSLRKNIRQFSTVISYSEQITQYNYLELDQVAQPALDPNQDPLIDPDTGLPLTETRYFVTAETGTFLRRITHAQLRYKAFRNDFRLLGNIEERDFIETDTDSEIRYAGFNWNYNLSQRSVFSFKASYQQLVGRQAFGGNVYRTYDLGYVQKIRKHLEARASILHWNRETPDDATISANTLVAQLYLQI
jgi:uncharacterized protein (PEP-CTERM system associated)